METDLELIARAQNGEAAAADQLLRRYNNFIQQVAYKTAYGKDIDMDDAVQVARIAFWKAIQTYDVDHSKGNGLSVWALYKMRWAIYNELKRLGRQVPHTDRFNDFDTATEWLEDDEPPVPDRSREELLREALLLEYPDTGSELVALLDGENLHSLTASEAVWMLTRPGLHTPYLDFQAFAPSAAERLREDGRR